MYYSSYLESVLFVLQRAIARSAAKKKAIMKVYIFLLVLLSSAPLKLATRERNVYPPVTVQRNTGSNICASNTEAIMKIKSDINAFIRNISVFHSCKNIPAESPSGYYHIRNNITGDSVLKYCDMNRTSCCTGREGGWMRVANIDMTDPNQQCPQGLELWTHPLNPSFSRRLCDRTSRSWITDRNDYPSCNSTIFPVNGVRYSRVCGKIKAFQFNGVNAFSWYAIRGSSQTTIDVPYVDGISLTHGSPRQHIWSFAAGLQEPPSGHATSRCPCAGAFGTVPPFVGQDYFCDSGAHAEFQALLYDQDPLWDGQGCGVGYSACCSFNSPPWFCKELPHATTDDIELRMCGDHFVEDEATPLELIELYVQ